ncbi:MAG: hypothetical protein WEF86_03650 [Gemmatimonadota bacterium]
MTMPEDAGECLARSVAGLTGAAVERRHEALMEWAETELQLDRGYAEQVYTLAEEEELEPVYGFLLIRCGIGVTELEPPDGRDEEESSQQAPPGWVGQETVELDNVGLERRLRSSFRRMRGHLERAATSREAVASFLAEPDVGPLRLR